MNRAFPSAPVQQAPRATYTSRAFLLTHSLQNISGSLQRAFLFVCFLPPVLAEPQNKKLRLLFATKIFPSIFIFNSRLCSWTFECNRKAQQSILQFETEFCVQPPPHFTAECPRQRKWSDAVLRGLVGKAVSTQTSDSFLLGHTCNQDSHTQPAASVMQHSDPTSQLLSLRVPARCLLSAKNNFSLHGLYLFQNLSFHLAVLNSRCVAGSCFIHPNSQCSCKSKSLEVTETR